MVVPWLTRASYSSFLILSTLHTDKLQLAAAPWSRQPTLPEAPPVTRGGEVYTDDQQR